MDYAAGVAVGLAIYAVLLAIYVKIFWRFP
jgi:hypothetical protein